MSIEMKNYTVELSSAKVVAEAMNCLPSYQTIRGANQWNAEKRENLIKDILAGLYVPPVVFAIMDHAEGEDGDNGIVDGQQRGRAIADAVKAGTLKGDEPILVAIDKARTGAEAFRVLNIGVPVGSALVTAVSLDGIAGKALLAIAEHKALDLVPWSAIQTGRTEKAAFAASLLAIASGWSMVESSTKACEAWLKEHSAEVDEDGKASALAIADCIAKALAPYAETAEGTDKKRAKIARKVLGSVRKKNNWITLCQLVKDEYSAEEAVALFADSVTWSKGGKYRPSAVKGGGRVKSEVAIPMGGGSSGNAIDTAKRLDAAVYFLAEGGDFVCNPYEELDAETDVKTERNAAEKVATIDGDALAKALGM